MENSDDKESKSLTPNITTIAYSESKKIIGSDDCSENIPNGEQEKNFECVNRIKNLSLIVEMRSSVSEAYDSLKKSHDTVASVLDTTENQISEAKKILSPFTNKIGKILDEPLKNVDNAICNGFDYFSEKVPQVKEESTKIYGNIGEYIKTTSDSAMTYSNSIATNIKKILKSPKDD